MKYIQMDIIKLHFLNISLKEQQNPNFNTNGLITKFDDLNFGRHLPGHKNKRKKNRCCKKPKRFQLHRESLTRVNHQINLRNYHVHFDAFSFVYTI